ncbi:MAG: hypothetical protein LBD99_03200 [Candidatus Margulisbacteria bacterium]|jgi:hypothetical protein|nr:hypothetical protein [Candidatus Margulisiibacteriota bacterium]
MSIGSVEDSVIAKLKLNELRPGERITALINYFNSVIIGQIKTNPVELKAVLNLLNDYKAEDTQKAITGYLNTHQISIDYFFSNNMQRFDRFEFKPYFLRLKGLEPGQEFAVPVNAKRNFENIRPFNTRLYRDILEKDPQETRAVLERLSRIDAYAAEARRLSEAQGITARINALTQKIADKIQTGRATRENILEKLRFVEEQFIPALQIRYNEPALNKLAELFLGGAKQQEAAEVFASLNMPQGRQSQFCAALEKKI